MVQWLQRAEGILDVAMEKCTERQTLKWKLAEISPRSGKESWPKSGIRSPSSQFPTSSQVLFLHTGWDLFVDYRAKTQLKPLGTVPGVQYTDTLCGCWKKTWKYKFLSMRRSHCTMLPEFPEAIIQLWIRYLKKNCNAYNSQWKPPTPKQWSGSIRQALKANDFQLHIQVSCNIVGCPPE